jgi:hypothetical protein
MFGHQLCLFYAYLGCIPKGLLCVGTGLLGEGVGEGVFLNSYCSVSFS